ncbi:DivIVA domain-containing protein [Pedococcus sp.]|uniref:DivIVA domain-containing protein n=1 Tax=Pedococcus sp. TaxID=2860345 RepID=UPI002E13A6CF|nr:DivIVA domain-containing protein [Pedococcus sp.]
MIWVFFIAVAVVLVAGFAALIAGRVGYDPLAEAPTTQHDAALPEELHAQDVADVHFDTALRGYRMDQVDAVLDQLQRRIAELEAGHGADGQAPAADGQARPEPST